MKEDTGYDLARAHGEEFGRKIAKLIMPLRSYAVTIDRVDDEFAYVTMHNDAEPLPVPLTVFNGMYVAYPNPGSISIIAFSDGDDNQPFFLHHSQIDKIEVRRGSTTSKWSITPPERDDEGNEADPDPEKTADTITITLGDTTTITATKDVVEAKVDKTKFVMSPTEVSIDAEGSTVRMDKDVIEMNGGSLSSLVVIGKLTERLNKLQKEIDMIQTNIASHSHTYIDSKGAAAAPTPSTTTATTYSKATISTFADGDYENTKITQ